MTNKQFLQQFGHFIDAPNGIQKLREMILQLAVQGKLVEQDAGDEPASKLLERIKAEKAKMIADGEIKKGKALPKISYEEKPYKLPIGWEWVRLGNITTRIGSGSTPRGGKNAYVDSGVIFLRSQNVWNEGLKLNDVAYITEDTHEKMSNTRIVGGDILLNITGASLGRCTIFPRDIEEANVSQHVTIIRPVSSQFGRYLHLAILSPLIQGFIWGRQVGMAREGLSKKVLELFEFPIPPLAEQHRIVAKVDELMALCDRLETERNAREATHQRLIRAVHHPLTEANDTTAGIDSLTAWRRIRDNFADLYTTLESVQALRQTILQLAVQGKLVAQDNNNEPASILLERINAERKERQKNERIKFPSVATISNDDAPYNLPQGWSWARLGQIIKISSGDGLTAKNMADNGNIPVFGGNGINGYHNNKNINEPTLVIGRVGFYCGSIHLTPEQAWVTDNAFITDYSKSNFDQKFLYWLLKGTNLKERDSATAQPVISGRKVYPIVVGIPPLEEQPKIVKKLEGLMALCNQLEANIRAKSDTAARYAEAIVQQIAAA